MPLGRPVLSAKPFIMPRPAFGPGSVGYVTRKTPPAVVDEPSNAGDVEESNEEARTDTMGGLAVWGQKEEAGTRRTDYF